MTRAEAKAKVGKRVRTLDSSHGVPKGMEGTVIDARPAAAIVGGFIATDGGGTPKPTDEGWIVDVEFDDPGKTGISLDEWDDSLLEL